MSEEENKDSQTPEATPVAEVDKNEEANKLKQEMLYMRAEFENAKKRLHKDQEQRIRYNNEALLKELLNVEDLLERALNHGKALTQKGQTEWDNFYNGVAMTHKELLQFFSKSGVEWVGKVGEPFDPNRHEAISYQEGEGEEGLISSVYQKGSLYQGRLLVPAKVVVNSKKA